MAEAGDTVPLLVDNEDVSYGCKVPRNGGGTQWNDVSSLTEINVLSDDRITEQVSQNESAVICVFVAAFDIRKGNIIEWCIPEQTDLEGVEFKALASGSHKMRKDFTYFRRGNLYGLSCFEHLAVDSVAERGSRMKSVGILATSYNYLYQYLPFLEEQVRFLLENPGEYDQLTEFYERKKGVLTGDLPQKSLYCQHLPNSTNGKVVHISGCFSQFVKFFNVNTLILWKFALLKKRILFFSPPPAGAICYRVYCCNMMTYHDFPGIHSKINTPWFYLGLADSDTLESESTYIACTTENILVDKTQLYDLFVDNQNLRASIPLHKELMVPSLADKRKYDEILDRYQEQQSFDLGLIDDEDEEELFSSYFREMNTTLFQNLAELSYDSGKELTADMVTELGFDPVGDRQFIIELVETYGFDVTVAIDRSCCTKS